MKGIQFDRDDKIVEAPKLRSRIKENFTMAELQSLYDLCSGHMYQNNNQKVDQINYLLRNKGFVELGSGTNRYAMLKDNYVFKFALDRYGFDDNNVEFEMGPKLQPFVTKTYECNGLIAVAEYVNIISLNDFHSNKEVIRGILKEISKEYLFADLGAIDKNFRNWGYTDGGELVILDYGYVFERDDILMRCFSCHSTLGYDHDYNAIKCSKCGRAYNVHDIRSMMNASDAERARLFAKQEEVRITIDPGVDTTPDDSFATIS